MNKKPISALLITAFLLGISPAAVASGAQPDNKAAENAKATETKKTETSKEETKNAGDKDKDKDKDKGKDKDEKYEKSKHEDKPVKKISPDYEEDPDDDWMTRFKDSEVVDNAFNKDVDKVLEAQEKVLKWEKDKRMVNAWTNSIDGEEQKFIRQAGYQQEFLRDLIKTTKAHLGNGKNGSKKGVDYGEKVTGIANGEVGEGAEKYLDWYGDLPEGSPWGAAYFSYIMDKAGLANDKFWKKTASVTEARKRLTSDLGFKSAKISDLAVFKDGESGLEAKVGDAVIIGDAMGTVTKIEKDSITVVLGGRGDKVEKITIDADSDSDLLNGEIISIEYPKGSGNATGEGNAPEIFNALVDAGFSPAAACGIIGNMVRESGLDPKIKQIGGGPGRGLCQWEEKGPGGSDRWTTLRKWCNERDMDEWSIEGQCAFLHHEIESGSVDYWFRKNGTTKEEFINATDVEWATRIFLICFERGPVRDIPRNLDKSLGHAKDYYAKWGDL